MSFTIDSKKWEQLIQRHIDELLKNDLPLIFSLEIFRSIEEENDGVVFEKVDKFQKDDIIMVNVTIQKELCETLEFDYTQQLAFIYPDDYPFVPPIIELETYLCHKLINKNGEVTFSDFNPLFRLSQQIIHVYLIILDAIKSPNNENVIANWNKMCREKTDGMGNNDDDDDGDA